jgi:G3E family GTPase
LTGFLGSGKTTLLSLILRAEHGKRIAVVENEFGEGLGIESMIAKSGVDGSSLEGFFELGNGCICCTVKDELASTLEQLVRHKDRFDYLIIETTGVANPGPIIETFWLDEELESCLKLDGVVTVVDAVNILRELDDPCTRDEATMQIGYADRILVNKCDLVTDVQAAFVEERVRSLNGAAQITRTTYSEVSVQWVLDIDCFSFEALAEVPAYPPRDTHECHEGCTEHLSESTSTHDIAKYATQSFVFEGMVDILQIQRFLGSLIWEAHSSGMQIYRMKGLLRGTSSEHLHILQAVHQLLDVQVGTVTTSLYCA